MYHFYNFRNSGGAIAYRRYTHFFPSPIGAYVDLAMALRHQDLPVEKVAYPSRPASRFRKIVLIVDESVRGDFLSLNTPSIDTTPFLAAESHEIFNFGIASSLSNCSLQSRTMLRHGFRVKDIDANWHGHVARPTIWQYARTAAFRTVHINSFGTPVALVNGMGAEERSYIDERMVVEQQPAYLRYSVVASKLRELLRDPTPMFIFVEKYGVHVPYDRMYPATENVFSADRSLPFSLSNRAELVRHYSNAVRWSVDGFFRLCSNRDYLWTPFFCTRPIMVSPCRRPKR